GAEKFFGPEVPTMEEAGVNSFRSDTWNALAAPPKDARPDRGQAQCRDQRRARGGGDRGAPARDEHEPARRHAGGGARAHRAGERALGRGDSRREDQRGLARRKHSRRSTPAVSFAFPPPALT